MFCRKTNLLYFLTYAIILFLLSSCFRRIDTESLSENPFSGINTEQIDDLLLQMTEEEKIGQLIIGKTSIKYEWDEETVSNWVLEGKIGGLILENIELETFVDVAWNCKQISNIPLLMATEQQVALHNQFSDLVHFPTPSTISSIDSNELQKTIANHFLQQCKGLGINLSLAPGISQQLAHKEYNYHNFENNPFEIMARSIPKINQLKNNRILSIGNSIDHYSDNLDAYNSEKIGAFIKTGISGFVLGKDLFTIDTFHHHPKYFLSDFFNKKLKFNGLFISKIENEITVNKAFHAGTDLFITSDIPNTYNTIQGLLASGKMTEKVLNEKVRKILSAKSWTNGGKLKFNPRLAKRENPSSQFTSPKAIQKPIPNSAKKRVNKTVNNYFKNPIWSHFVKNLHESSVTLCNNYQDLLPYSDLYSKDFRIIQFGNNQVEVFKSYFGKYAPFKSLLYKPNRKGKFKSIDLTKSRFSTPVIILNELFLNETNKQSLIKEIVKLNQRTSAVIVNFGDPRNLSYFDSTFTKIQVFERNEATEAFAAKLLFGGVSAHGRLPINLNQNLKFGSKIVTAESRLNYFAAETVGIDSERLTLIDSIAEYAINIEATPGCQILIAKEGSVIYSKAFGYHTYRKKQKVKTKDLYDLASVTKIASTTLSMMKMVDDQQISIEDSIGYYISQIDSPDVKKLLVKELLVHQSGLQSNMPISRYIRKSKLESNQCNPFFCKKREGFKQIKVCNKLYFDINQKEEIWKSVYSLIPENKSNFKYSDVNFNLLQKIIESKSELAIDEYAFQSIYKPLGMQRASFNPLEKFLKSEIAPTELDTIWRNELLRGYVHDPTAALMGGVCGSAGLFSNAEDLVILFQMLLNEGEYGDVQYLKPETVNLFTSATEYNSRGLGFNKPGFRAASGCSSSASPATFGHSGFTGTCVWVDPAHDLIYIFLSNRVHPSAKNKTLLSEKIRKRIHQVVYNSIDSYKMKLPKMEFVSIKI